MWTLQFFYKGIWLHIAINARVIIFEIRVRPIEYHIFHVFEKVLNETRPFIEKSNHLEDVLLSLICVKVYILELSIMFFSTNFTLQSGKPFNTSMLLH